MASKLSIEGSNTFVAQSGQQLWLNQEVSPTLTTYGTLKVQRSKHIFSQKSDLYQLKQCPTPIFHLKKTTSVLLEIAQHVSYVSCPKLLSLFATAKVTARIVSAGDDLNSPIQMHKLVLLGDRWQFFFQRPPLGASFCQKIAMLGQFWVRICRVFLPDEYKSTQNLIQISVRR